MENNIVRAFDNPEFGKVRILNENDEILFCASDVAKALGYTNPNKAVNDHCRAITKRSPLLVVRFKKLISSLNPIYIDWFCALNFQMQKNLPIG